MSDVLDLHEHDSESWDAKVTLELADLEDHGETVEVEARRRLVQALFVTLIAPVNFVIHAVLFWQHGWPPAGAAGLTIVSLLAVSAWIWWAYGCLRAIHVRAYVARRRSELERGRRPMIRTALLWSAEGT